MRRRVTKRGRGRKPATRRAYRLVSGRFISKETYLSLPKSQTQTDTIRVVLPKPRKKAKGKRRRRR